jgi:hypothetical protein
MGMVQEVQEGTCVISSLLPGSDTASGRAFGVASLIGPNEDEGIRHDEVTKDIEIHPRDPREIPLIRKARPLNPTTRIP